MCADSRGRGESVPDLDPFVGGVDVHDQVQLALGVGAGDLEERQELLVAVARMLEVFGRHARGERFHKLDELSAEPVRPSPQAFGTSLRRAC